MNSVPFLLSCNCTGDRLVTPLSLSQNSTISDSNQFCLNLFLLCLSGLCFVEQVGHRPKSKGRSFGAYSGFDPERLLRCFSFYLQHHNTMSTWKSPAVPIAAASLGLATLATLYASTSAWSSKATPVATAVSEEVKDDKEQKDKEKEAKDKRYETRFEHYSPNTGNWEVRHSAVSKRTREKES